MKSIESTSTLAETLQEYREEILQTKKLFEICATDDIDEQLMLLSNYAFLTGAGKVSREEYFRLLQQCAEDGDYYDLGALFLKMYMLWLHRKMGDQGVKEHRAFRQGELEGLEEVRERDGKNPLSHIGSPALEDLPNWILAIDQSGLSMTEIYELLEGGRVQKFSATSDPTAQKIMTETRSQLPL